MSNITDLILFNKKTQGQRSKGRKLWDNFLFKADQWHDPLDTTLNFWNKKNYSRTANFLRWYNSSMNKLLGNGRKNGRYEGEAAKGDKLVKMKLIDY